MAKRQPRPTARDHAYLVWLALTGDPDPAAIDELAARLRLLWLDWRCNAARRNVRHEP